MKSRLGLAALAMAIGAILAGAATVAQPAAQTPTEPRAPATQTPGAEHQLTGTGGVPPPAHPAYSIDSADLDSSAIGSRSYRIDCQVSIGTCSIAADGPGQSCYCDAKGRPGRYWGTTVAP